MTTIDYAIIIIPGAITLLVGFFLGLLPLQNDQLTSSQKSWSQVVSLIGIGLVVILIFLGKNTASWICIGTMVLGLLIAILPPIKRAMLTRFSWFQPQPTSNKSRNMEKGNNNRQDK